MDLVILAVKSDLTNVLNAGRYMLASLFLLAVLINYIGILTQNINWSDVIIRLAIGFILLQNYVWVMDTTRNIVIGVDEMVNPNQDWVSQYAIMNNNIQNSFNSSIQQNIVAQVTNMFVGKTLHNLIINLSFICYAVISKIMEAVRYSMVAIMYKLGPVLIPLILFQGTGRVVKGWFTSYISVLCWPILWHIVLAIAVNISNQPAGQAIEQFASLNFAVCFVLVFSPFIINSLVAGVGMGSSSALAGILSTNTIKNLLTGLGYKGITTSGAAITPVIQNIFSNKKTPTTADGAFKNHMLGKGSNDQGGTTA